MGFVVVAAIPGLLPHGTVHNGLCVRSPPVVLQEKRRAGKATLVLLTHPARLERVQSPPDVLQAKRKGINRHG